MVLCESEDEILHPAVVASQPQSYLKHSATNWQRNNEDVDEEHDAFVGIDFAMTQALNFRLSSQCLTVIAIP